MDIFKKVSKRGRIINIDNCNCHAFFLLILVGQLLKYMHMKKEC